MKANIPSCLLSCTLFPSASIATGGPSYTMKGKGLSLQLSDVLQISPITSNQCLLTQLGHGHKDVPYQQGKDGWSRGRGLTQNLRDVGLNPCSITVSLCNTGPVTSFPVSQFPSVQWEY